MGDPEFERTPIAAEYEAMKQAFRMANDISWVELPYGRKLWI